MKRSIQISALLVVALAIILLAVVAQSAPAAPSYPPVKQTFEASGTQTRSAAQAQPLPPPRTLTPLANAPTLAPVPRAIAGNGWIVDDFTPPFPAMSHVIRNLWYTENGTQRTLVYAGALRDEPSLAANASHSVVIVQIENAVTGQPIRANTILAPTAAGALRIVNAVGARLVLQADNGATFYFDVSAEKFVATLN
jgi:hypothetical protein